MLRVCSEIHKAPRQQVGFPYAEMCIYMIQIIKLSGVLHYTLRHTNAELQPLTLGVQQHCIMSCGMQR